MFLHSFSNQIFVDILFLHNQTADKDFHTELFKNKMKMFYIYYLFTYELLGQVKSFAIFAYILVSGMNSRNFRELN